MSPSNFTSRPTLSAPFYIYRFAPAPPSPVVTQIARNIYRRGRKDMYQSKFHAGSEESHDLEFVEQKEMAFAMASEPGHDRGEQENAYAFQTRHNLMQPLQPITVWEGSTQDATNTEYQGKGHVAPTTYCMLDSTQSVYAPHMVPAIPDLASTNTWPRETTYMDLGLDALNYASLGLENNLFINSLNMQEAQNDALQAPFTPFMPAVFSVPPLEGALQQQAEPSGTPKERHVCNVPGCQKTFGRPAEFRRHKETVHGKNNKFRCMVESCDYTYPRLDKVREHMRRVHKLRVQME